MKSFPLTQADFYKLSHKKFMHSKTEFVYANLTPRSGKYAKWADDDKKVVFFGLQYFIKDFLIEQFNKEFFEKPKCEVISKFKRRCDLALGKDAILMDHFEKLHDIGYLPIAIKALKEGSKVNIKVPVLTIYNTHPDFAWLVTYLETVLSCELWQPITSATSAYQYKKLCDKFADMTVGNRNHVMFQCHDFSARGMAGRHAGAISGAGHLLSFNGTDTVSAIDLLEDYYSANAENEFIAASVPASEHSVTSLGSSVDGEFETIKRWITKDYPTGIVSVVSDTYDFWNVLTNYLTLLKDEILSRKPNDLGLSKVVVRPDCYSEDTMILTNSGWKLFKDLLESDLVAQVTDGGYYEFVKPLKYVEQEYTGTMHSFKDYHGKVDLLVTPNHRMVLQQNGKERIVFAEKLGTVGNYKQSMYRSAKAKSSNVKLTYLERLAIAFQADGYYVTGTKSSIRFSFTKQRKIDRLKSLLNSAKLEYVAYELSDNRVEFHVKTDATKFKKDLSWVDISNLSFEWCVDFIEELSYWDSCRRSDDRFKFDSTTKSVADVVEYIALSAGYGCLVSEYEDNRKEVFNTVYTVHILKDNRVGGQSWVNEKVNYSGKVYCVHVPSGKVIVKRNRCTMVCGNSGDPVDIICGTVDEFGKGVSPEQKGSIELLWDVFGGTINNKGYKELDSHIGLIYGDSITIERAKDIFERLEKKGFASSNVVFGVGSFTYQMVSRDTLGMAVKATYAVVDGEGKELFKDPITDNGTKKSARGLLRVEKDGDNYVLHDKQTEEQEKEGELKIVFENGKLLLPLTLQEIRENLKS